MEKNLEKGTNMIRKKFVRYAVLFAMLLLLLSGGRTVLAASMTVDNTIACDDVVGLPYCTIQAAVDDAAPDDTINVAAGTYVENVIVDLALTLQGTPGATIAPATGVGVEIQASSVTVDGFTINTWGLNAHGVWISVSATSLTLTGNDIVIDGYSTAIYADAGVSQTVKSSGWTISGNTLSAAVGVNLELYDVDAVTVDDNVFGITAGSNVIVSSELFDLTGIAFTNNDVQGNNGGSMVAFVTDFQGIALGGIVRNDGILTAMDDVTVAGNTFAGWDSRALRFGDWGNPVTNVVVNSNIFNMSVDSEVIGGADAGSATGAGNTFNVQVPAEIQDAIDSAFSGDTVNVAPGTYDVGLQIISNDIQIVGDAGNKPVIRPIADITGTGAAEDAWFLVEPNVTFSLASVVLDGDGFWVWQAIRSHGNTSISNVDFRNIRGSVDGSPYKGIAVSSYGGIVAGGVGSDSHGGEGDLSSNLLVLNSSFVQIGRIGVIVKGTGSAAEIIGNTYTGKGDGDFLDYAFELGGGGLAAISGNTITGNRGVALVDGSTSAGVLATTYWCLTLPDCVTTALIEDNSITGNTDGVHIGYAPGPADTSVVTIHRNNLSGNTAFAVISTDAVVNSTDNWWGSANGPSHESNTFNVEAQGDAVSDNVDFVPWLDALDGAPFAPVVNDESESYTSISAAINGTEAGGTVTASSGTYVESLVIAKPLTLRGPNASISPHSESRVAEAIITGVSPLVQLPSEANVNPLIIEGFTFQDTTGSGAVIYANGESDGWGNVTIRSNRFMDNYGPAIGVWTSTLNEPINPANWTISDNLINGVTGPSRSGIYLALANPEDVATEFSGWEISNNRIRNTQYGGIMVHGAVDMLISGNIVEDVQKTGIQSSGIQGNVTITDNLILRAMLASESGPIRAGIRLYGTDPTDEYGESQLIGPVWVTDNVVEQSYIGFATKSGHDYPSELVHVNGNSFVGNIEAGLLHNGNGLFDAKGNWWGTATGPSGEGPGQGDAVGPGISFEPWLTRLGFQVTLSNESYLGFGYQLNAGWETFSIPVWAENETFFGAWEVLWTDMEGNPGPEEGGIPVPRLSGLVNEAIVEIAYRFNAATQEWEQILDVDTLSPFEAVYVKSRVAHAASLNVTPDLTSPPTYQLQAGWNLVGMTLDPLGSGTMAVPEAFISAYDAPGGIGYLQVFSPAVNPTTFAWARDSAQDPIPQVEIGRGYWVFMENPDTIAGFSSTPLTLE
ncbi:MAG: right-handed parallel beta-helix repeat-containing protein [Patescibacteria group bacterium]|nr:right-handed parallel beta-helix repeat-containing protein [Patescibacteria group bacterium]